MNRKIFLGIITLVLLGMSILSVRVKQTVISVDDSEYKNGGNAGEVTEGTIVEYNYTSDNETIEGYEFLFATYGDKLKQGTVHLEVYDKNTKELLAEGKLPVNELEDNQLNLIKTKRINLGRRDIRVLIFCEGLEESSKMTLWLGENKENQDGYTLVNGIPLENNLLIFTRKVTEEASYTWDMILITSICFVIFCSVSAGKKEKQEGQPGGSDELEEKNN